MDVFETLDSLGAELVANRAVVVSGTKRTVVARMLGGIMTLTAEGQEMASANEVAPKKPAPKKPAPKKPAQAELPRDGGFDPDAFNADMEGLDDGNG